MKKKILLIGGGGFLGKEIRKQLEDKFTTQLEDSLKITDEKLKI